MLKTFAKFLPDKLLSEIEIEILYQIPENEWIVMIEQNPRLIEIAPEAQCIGDVRILKNFYTPALDVTNALMKQVSLSSNGVWILSFLTAPAAPFTSVLFGIGGKAGLFTALTPTALRAFYGLSMISELALWNIAYRGGFMGWINAAYYDLITGGQNANPYLWAENQSIISA